MRDKCNSMALEDTIKFLNAHDNPIAIFDGTNHTHKMRMKLVTAVSICIGIVELGTESILTFLN